MTELQSCVNNPISECDLHPSDWVKDAKMPTFRDVQNYFANPEQCNIRVVYIDSNNEASFIDNVKFKKIDDCVRYFTQARKYYYVYLKLLRNILVWSAHPILGGLEGVIGHHITIGHKQDGSMDIHERMYTVKHVKQYHIIAGKTNRTYAVHPKSFQLISQTKPPPHFAPIIWNEILEYMKEGTNMVGGMGNVDPSIILAKRTAYNARVYSIAELFEVIESRVTKALNEMTTAEDEVAFIRIPYVPAAKEAHAQKRLAALMQSSSDSRIQDITLVSEHHIEYSALIVSKAPSVQRTPS